LLNRVTELEATLDQVRNEAQNRRKEVDYLEQQLGMRRDTEIEVHRQQRDLTDELESLQTEVANLKTKL
jgi:chromosome segregation ATPase